MLNYKLLILGRQTPKKNWEMADSDDCWGQMTISLLEEFKKVSHISTEIAHIHHPKRDGYDYEKLPKADAVLFCGLPVTFDQIDLAKLKMATGYKKMFSFLERGLGNPAIDWTFEFKLDNTPNTTFIPGPINKKLYQVIPKTPKTILLDSCYCISSICWAHCIEAWLEPLKDEYKIYRLIRHEENHPQISNYVTPIKETTSETRIGVSSLVNSNNSFNVANIPSCSSSACFTYEPIPQSNSTPLFIPKLKNCIRDELGTKPSYLQRICLP
jgi:hypothetical protein